MQRYQSASSGTKRISSAYVGAKPSKNITMIDQLNSNANNIHIRAKNV